MVWINGRPLTVVGIVRDAGLQLNVLNAVIVSDAVAKDLALSSDYVTVDIKVLPGAAGQVAQQAPLAWAPFASDEVDVDSPPDPRQLRDVIESNVAIMLVTLTVVTLLAAVLSLTNSMTSAVFQRAGEFGLRRAIGARRIHIVGLVQAEGLILGLFGGIIGVYLAVIAVLMVTAVRHWQPVLNPFMIPLGICGGVVVGLLGGFVATLRASRIQPSHALRSA